MKLPSLIVTVLAFTLVALIYAPTIEVRHASACIPAAYTFDELVRQAHFVGIVETTSVGDGVIREPPLPTPTPTPVDSSVPSSTPTPTNTIARETPSFPTIAPEHWYASELTGQSAHASVIEQIGGDAVQDIEIDVLTRRNYEQGIRLREARGGLTSCGLIPAPKYEPATRYLVVLETYGSPDLATARRFQIDGSDVILTDNPLDLNEPVYRRYLSHVSADLREYGDSSGRLVATTIAPRVPLSQLLMMMRAVRTGIAPPDTGSAGLAANR